jgi:hypothetical protein
VLAPFGYYQLYEIKMCNDGVVFIGKVFVPSLMKIGEPVEMLKGKGSADTHPLTHTHRGWQSHKPTLAPEERKVG